jgi:plasmid stabilization system protein ParE
MNGYFFSEKARQDIGEIWLYIAEDSINHADRLREEFEAAGELLAEHPGIGHTRNDLTRLPVRFWPVGVYLVIYHPDTRPIEIVRILHGQRDLPSILG